MDGPTIAQGYCAQNRGVARSRASLTDILIAIGALLVIQFAWLLVFDSGKIAQINLLPGLIFMPLVAIFADYAWGDAPVLRRIFLGSILLLSLRLPITLTPEFIWLNWLVFWLLGGLVFQWLYGQLRKQQCGKAFWFTVAIILFNALSHQGLESPYTHTFHLITDQPSNYQGVDNNQTWECAYEIPAYPVHCDARHFIAAEKVFSESEYDPGFSVVLTRFFGGYLKSFIGIEGQRWLSSLSVHLLFWLLACAAIFRLSLLVELPVYVAQAAMLSTASAWGFVSMVAQPAPYFLSYAFAAISCWATAEVICDNKLSMNKTTLLLLILIAGFLVYEMYPITLACAALMVVFGRARIAVLMLAGQFAASIAWKYIGLATVLGTLGNVTDASSGVSNLSRDISVWLGVFQTLNIKGFLVLSWYGTKAYLFGNLVYGALAALIVLGCCFRRCFDRGNERILWAALLVLNLLVLGATVFIVPQMIHWSPNTGMQPRLAFFSFPLNLLALCYLAAYRVPRAALAVPVVLFILANIDLSGFASQSMMFDYGRLALYWY